MQQIFYFITCFLNKKLNYRISKNINIKYIKILIFKNIFILTYIILTSSKLIIRLYYRAWTGIQLTKMTARLFFERDISQSWVLTYFYSLSKDFCYRRLSHSFLNNYIAIWKIYTLYCIVLKSDKHVCPLQVRLYNKIWIC